jgi:hypothetical protein
MKDFYRDEAFYDLPVQIDNVRNLDSTGNNTSNSSRARRKSGGRRGSNNSAIASSESASPALSIIGSTLSLASSLAGAVGDWVGMPFRSTRIYQCLDSFFRTESLTGDSQFQCDYCKRLTDGEKTLFIKKLPEVDIIYKQKQHVYQYSDVIINIKTLVLQLKRFRYSYFSSKIRSHVDFPKDELDMADYLSPDLDDEQMDARYELYGMCQQYSYNFVSLLILPMI